jgi:hypothetical protein
VFKLGILASLFAQVAYWSGQISSPLWSIAAPSGSVRWIEIHNLESAKAEGLYHVQVLERRSIDPPWKFHSLAPHMALTEEALRASVIAPFKRGSVYPETFDGGYAKWRSAQAQNHAFVCKSSVTACLTEAFN